MRSVLRFILYFSLLSVSCSLLGANEYRKWAVYYSDKANVRKFDPYDLVVLDSDHHPSIPHLIQRNKIVLGYISLGEVEDYRDWYRETKEEGILREENPNWKGSYYVDLRDNRWAKRVIEQLIPKLIDKQFSGIFIDTLDNAGYMESTNPEGYKGMKDAAVQLIKAIRLNYPQMKIMLNRGFDILPEVSNSIDMVLGESMLTHYNFKDKTHSFVDPASYRQMKELLQAAKKSNPNLEIYTLDYWDPKDTKTIKSIYKTQRESGFIPYVSTVSLDELYEEP